MLFFSGMLFFPVSKCEVERNGPSLIYSEHASREGATAQPSIGILFAFMPKWLKYLVKLTKRRINAGDALARMAVARLRQCYRELGIISS